MKPGVVITCAFLNMLNWLVAILSALVSVFLPALKNHMALA